MHKMKKLLLLLTVLYFSCLAVAGQLLEKENLGLISYLTDIRIRCELKMLTVIAEKKSGASNDISATQSAYNSVMIPVNRLINQLSADMIEKNNLVEYRRINKYVYKDKSQIKGRGSRYSATLIEIDRGVKALFPSIQAEAMTAYMMEQIVGSGKLGGGSIESARDFREKKVAKIIALLKDLRMRSVSELSETVKGGKEK
jgi:hypothetical protein